MNGVERARSALNRLDYRTVRALGQNFLLNEEILREIVDLADVGAGDRVLEIGAGCGVLTWELARRGASVLALEIDRDLRPVLDEVLMDVKAQVALEDALRCDLRALTREAFGEKPFCVVSNLPYGITTEMIRRLIFSGLPVTRLTLLVQKEAQERIMAVPGQEAYCARSAQVRYFGQTHLLKTVPPQVFTPPPHVESALIGIEPWEEDLRPVRPVDEEKFLKVLDAAFAMRRKTLVNNLMARFGLPRARARLLLEEAGVDPMARGEALPLERLCAIADALAREAREPS